MHLFYGRSPVWRERPRSITYVTSLGKTYQSFFLAPKSFRPCRTARLTLFDDGDTVEKDGNAMKKTRWQQQVLTTPDPALRAQVAGLVQAERRQQTKRIEPGTVVEFFREGGLSCGVVWPHPRNGRGYLILDLRGRKCWVRLRRLHQVSTSRIPATSARQALIALREVDERRQRESESLDLGILWDVAIEQAEREGVDTEPHPGFDLDELCDLLLDEGSGSDSHAAVLRALWLGDWFEWRGSRWQCLSREVVARRRRLADQRRRSAEEADRLAEWVRAVADGHMGARRPAGAERAISLLEEAALSGARGPGERQAALRTTPPGSAVAAFMARAHLHGPGAAFDVLVRLGHWSEHENLELHRWSVPEHFTREAIDEAERITGAADAPRSRRWWRRPLGFPAAGGSSCDRAFAIRRTLSGWKVTVFLAAPAALVEKDSRLDEEARLRGTAISLPDRDIHLLPPPIAAAARLAPGKWTETLAVDIGLSADLTPNSVDFGLRRTRPRVVADSSDAAADKQLSTLLAWSSRLRAKRLERAVLPPVPFPRVRVADGDAVSASSEITASEMVDEELTHLAAQAIGGWCRDNVVPCVFKTRAGSPEALQEAGAAGGGATGLPALVLHRRAQRLLTRESLQTDPAPHRALGIDAYASIGFPLDRFEDLMMQRQLIAVGRGESPVYESEDLDRGLAETASAREAASAVARAGRRYWSLKSLEERVGEELDVTVTDRAGLGYFVVAEATGCGAHVPAKGEMRAHPGDTIRVRLEQVSARRDILRLALS